MVAFWSNFHSNANIGSDNGLAPNRRHAIIWTNDSLVYSRIYALPGLDELTCPSVINLTLTLKICTADNGLELVPV